jgi:DNA sulfur modification protein DndC
MSKKNEQQSVLGRLSEVHKDIQEHYLNYPYPWVIGYSGGKDSTTTLQLVWNALAELPPEKRQKKVYVISTDTLVETPVIIEHVNDTLQRISDEAIKQDMPFQTQKLSPILNNRFWVNLIGRGYPAPNSGFRWCTDRLKISPSNRFILDRVAEQGEVILVLGSRRGESINRDKVLKRHEVAGYKLAIHGQLPGAWVYMPIEHFSVDDVWTYLLQVPSPWGSDNRQLSSMYRSAQDGECPLVVDTTTPSCGNSRFGCWVCTVVTRDKSMEAMIDSGEEWMTPLLEFRDWLSSTQDLEVKPMQREFKGRDGRIKITEDGRLRYRTYTLEFSKKMLRRLLETQKEVQEEMPDFLLIGNDEIQEIRRLWLTERQDWQDSIPSIFSETMGQDLRWDASDISRPGQLDERILQQVMDSNGVPIQLVQKLLDAEWQHYGMRRRPLIHKRIEKIFGEDWRTFDDVQAEMDRRKKASQEEML